MRVYPRGRIYWHTWTGEDGATVRRTTGCTTKAAAELYASREERKRADPNHAAKEAARFVDESRIFLDNVKARPKVPEGTVNMYECKVGHLNRLMPARMSAIDVKAADAYFATRRDEGADPDGSTLYKEWIAMRGVLTSAKRRGHWTGDLDVLRPSWVTQSTKEKKRRLTWDELADLLAAAPADLADVVRYAVASGGRRAELQRAREGDANPETNVVLVRGSKTTGSWIEIPIPPVYRYLVPERAWGAKPTSKLLLPNCPHDLRCLDEVCASLKMERITYNDLRRTFSSLLLDGGMTNTVAAKLMRHKSTAMIDKFYGKMNDGALAALVAAQAAVQSPAAAPDPIPTTVPPVYQRSAKLAVQGEGTERVSRGFVGQDGLEPSANGLRVPLETAESPAKQRIPIPSVPPVYQGSSDPLETAIARAIEDASAAGRWDIVGQLAKELDDRRRDRDGVIDLADERRRRGSK